VRAEVERCGRVLALRSLHGRAAAWRSARPPARSGRAHSNN
jgi:hypothetical protein